MEDGFPLFDPNNESERQEQKLFDYYQSFSDFCRKRLLSKSISRPSNVYDVLYHQERATQLSKNIPFNNDLEQSAKIIRDKLIAKIVTDGTDLEKISADFRNSLLARAKIQDERNNLVGNGDAYRQNNLSKNVSKESDIEKASNVFRVNNVSKNNENISLKGDIEKNSESYQQLAISKNVSKEQDLLKDSDAFRDGDISKNVLKESSIEKDSDSFRDNNLAKNSTKPQSLDGISDVQRNLQLSKNVDNLSNLAEDSNSFRVDDVSKNTPKEQDVLKDSEVFRDGNTNKNVLKESEIEKDSDSFRKDNTSKNTIKVSDLEKDSESFRSDELALNKPKVSDIETDSVDFRSDELALNKPGITDLESDSAVFRDDGLALNKSKVSDLEKASESFRSDELSLNKSKVSDLEKDSTQFRDDELALNKPKATNLESDSTQFRDDELALNKPKATNLESDSTQFREDELALNKSKVSDLEKDSSDFRDDGLALNKSNATNLESDSVPFRDDDLAANTPNTTDLESDSVTFRDDDMAANTPNTTDLESDSVTFRDDDLAANIPSTTDLESDSVTFRDDDMAANTPNTTDLSTDSTPFLYNNLSSNVPNISNLEDDSIPFRNDDLSANVPGTGDLLADSVPFRNDDLSANVPGTGDLLADSNIFKNDNLAANVPINSNIAADSIPFRNDAISSNVPYNTNLLTDSTHFRKDAISKNAGFGLLGINFEGAGTSSFLGISRVFTQGILVRHLLKSKNKPNNSDLLKDSEELKDNNVRRNKYAYGNNEYTTASADKLVSGDMVGYFGESISSSVNTMLNSKATYNNNGAKILQELYGPNSSKIENDGEKTVRLGGGFFSTSINPSDNGGVFLDIGNPASTTYNVNQKEGSITSNIRNYSLQRSAFNIQGLQSGSLEAMDAINGNDSLGFQELINTTIGALRGNKGVGSQSQTNTTPLSVILNNDGAYYKGGNKDTDLLRPEAGTAELGSAESMMGKTVIGNPFEDVDFFDGKRGVKHVINTIKSSKNPMAANFDPQKSKAYIIGTNRDGSSRVSRQRYTIANPYAPQMAGKLLFSIKNYASGDQFYFPPYIESIQNTENANWNSVNFLGRPEAMYTYNTSSRDASISFYVLTDYSQSVDIGRNWNSEDMEKISATLPSHFTDSDISQNDSKRLEQERLQKLKDEQKKESANLAKKGEENSTEAAIAQADGEIDASGSTGSDQVKVIKDNEASLSDQLKESSKGGAESSAFLAQANTLASEIAKTVEAIGEQQTLSNIGINYSESNNTAGNIYNLNITKNEYNGSEIISKPEDTIDRINTLKSGLMFQPAFFSGDKVDFVRKIEFLSKLTRPAAASDNQDTGFSFTKPPISHIRLGDWWDHDIVVNSVSYDYADSPWTLDSGDGNNGRVQPMWVLVNINFHIIGPYGSANSRPPLATDKNGMYS